MAEICINVRRSLLFGSCEFCSSRFSAQTIGLMAALYNEHCEQFHASRPARKHGPEFAQWSPPEVDFELR